MADIRQTHSCDLQGDDLDFESLVNDINKDALATYNDLVNLVQTLDISQAELQVQGALDALDSYLKRSIFGSLESLSISLGTPKPTKPPSRGFGSGGQSSGDPGGSDDTPSSVVRRGTSVSTGTFPRPSISEENDNERLAALGIANCFGTVFADSGDDNFSSFRRLYLAVGRDYSRFQEIVRAMRSGEHLIVYSQITVAQFKPVDGNRQTLPSIEARLGFKLHAQDVWWDNQGIAYVPVRSYIDHNVPLWKISEKYDMAAVEINVFTVDYTPTDTGTIARFLNLGFSGQALQAIVSELDLLEFELDRILQLLSRAYNGVPANMPDVVISIKNAQQLMNMRVSKIPDRELIGNLEGKFGTERVKYLLDWRADLKGVDLTKQSSDLLRYLTTKIKSRPGSTKISNSLRDQPFDYIGKAQAMAHVCRNSALATQRDTTDASVAETRLRLFLLIAYLGGLVLSETITPILAPATAEMLSFYVDKSTRTVGGDAAVAPGVSTSVSTQVKTETANVNDVVGSTTQSSRSEVSPGVVQIVDVVTTVSDSRSKVTTTTTTVVKTQDGSSLSDSTLDSILASQNSGVFTGTDADANVKSFGSSLGDGQAVLGGQKTLDSPASLLVRNIDFDATFLFTDKIKQLASIPSSDLDIYGTYRSLVDKALKATASILQATCGRMQSLIKTIFNAWGNMFRDLETLLSATASLTLPGIPECLFGANLDLNVNFLFDLIRQSMNSVIDFLNSFNSLISSLTNMMCQASCMVTSLLGNDVPQLPCLKTIDLPNPIDELINQIQSICLFAINLMQLSGKSSNLLRTEISILPNRMAVLTLRSTCPCSTYGTNLISEALSRIPTSISSVIPAPKGKPYPLPL